MIQSTCETNNPFQMLQERIDSVFIHMEISDVCLKVLKEYKHEFTLHFPVKTDNGSTKLFIGYRVQHNDTREPFKGGKYTLTFPSTASGGKYSRIVPRLDPDTIITTPRYDVHYIVTEYGIADLRGKSVGERTKQLITIAHPDFREKSNKELDKIYVLYA